MSDPAFANCVNPGQEAAVAAAQQAATSSPVVTEINACGGDDTSYRIPLSVDVTFDGQTFSNIFVTTNSVITFGRPDGTYWDYPQTPSISLYSMDWVVYPFARADERLVIRSSDGGFQVDISARPIWQQNATEPTNIVITAAILSDGTVAMAYSVDGPTYDGQTRTGVRLNDGSVVSFETYGIEQITESPSLSAVATTESPFVPEPTASPTVSPEPLFLNPPTNLSAVVSNGAVQVSWDAPSQSNTSVEGYAIGWSTDNFQNNGWGWSHGQTSVTIPLDVLQQNGGLGNDFQFRIRADNNTSSVYSAYSNIISLNIPYPVTPPTIPQGASVYNEGQTAELIAPANHRISSILGYYGDPSDSRNGLDISPTLSQFIGSQSATIQADNELFGDPAPGIVKIMILLVAYELDPALQSAAEEAARLAAEQAARLEAERIAAEQAAEAARLEAIRLENERLAAEEAARVAAQQAAAAAEEAARLEAERVERERVSALEAAERLRQEQLAAEAERARLAAEEAARLAAEEAARIAAEEAARLAAEEAARLEAERIAAEEAARLAAEEAARLEAERLAKLEAERIAAEEAARLEAERLEAERLAKLEAERLEAERLEAERIAAEKAAAEEAERLEALEKAKAEEVARLEAERIAEEKAAEEEAERLAALEKAKAEEEARLEAEEKAREEAEAEANKPTPTEKPVVVEIKEPITAENITAVVEELATIQPQQLTEEQQTLIVEAALETFETAEQGSEEYEAALDALLVVAQADDIILDEELAAIPLIGNVAGAAVEVFNALGNAGADMSPQVREQSEKVVVASVIVANIAITATAAATSAAAVAARRP
jgi:hypothetical protein